MATRNKSYFKHGWDALKDPQISKMVDENGMEYYGCWWALVEEISRQAWENKSNKSGVIYERDLRNIFRKNRKHSRNVLETFRKHSLILFNFSEKFYNIDIPNLPKYLGSEGSNDSKRKSFDHIVRDRDRDKSIEVIKSIEPTIKPVDDADLLAGFYKQKTTKEKNYKIHDTSITLFLEKEVDQIPSLQKFRNEIDAWCVREKYTVKNFLQIVINYSKFFNAGKAGDYSKASLTNFLTKRDDYPKWLDDFNSDNLKSEKEKEKDKNEKIKIQAELKNKDYDKFGGQ